MFKLNNIHITFHKIRNVMFLFYLNFQDIERLCKIGLCVYSSSVHDKLASWKDNLDEEIVNLRNDWAQGSNIKYQLVGDNWDKNILPSFRYKNIYITCACIYLLQSVTVCKLFCLLILQGY